MDELISFNFEACPVRALTKNGEPWFMARDVGDVLDIGNIRETVRHFPQNEKGVITTDTLGGKQQTLIINEPGLYRMVFQSRKPEAERFKTWVFTKVLPEIRKTGGYGVSRISLSDANIFIKESMPRIKLYTSENARLWKMNRLYEQNETLRARLAKKNTPLSQDEKQYIRRLADVLSVAKVANETGRSETVIRKVIKGGRYENLHS